MKTTRIYDPVHQFIELDKWEFELTKTPAMQRLRAIYQISTANFCYSGGNHLRFDHSVGVMFLGTLIYDHVTDKAERRKELPKLGEKEYKYWRKVLRMACLCHDMGHTPTAHLCEKHLLKGEKHEAWTKRIILSKYVAPVIEQAGLDPMDVAKIAVGQEYFDEKFSTWEKIVCSMLTGDNFGADRMDYLIRDSYFTGLNYGVFDYHQLIRSLRIFRYESDLVLGVVENGLEACMALLMARYFMYKRLYQYSGVKSYSYHYSEFAKKYFEGNDFTKSVDDFLKTNDFELLAELYRIIADPNHPRYQEVLPLVEPKERFSAFSVSRLELENLKKMFSEFPEEIIFEEGSTKQRRGELSFPVLRKNGIITPAEQMSEFNLPERWDNWVFVSSAHKDLFIKKRGDVRQSNS